MRRIFAATFVAIFAFALCIQGARWQFERYEVRHAKNSLIRENISRSPLIEADLSKLPQAEIAWRSIEISGTFMPDKEILVRGRYHQDQYGFGVITLFKSQAGKLYWVDRGWVKAGPDARTPPQIRPLNGSQVTISARIRVEAIESQVYGTVFALPGGEGRQLSKWNNDGSVKTESVYFDLIKVSEPSFNPDVPTELPELSDGPHLAYTFQWLLFSGLVVFGLFLVIREERRTYSVKA